MHTPGGVRCTECAQQRRPPMYELTAGSYAWGALAAGGAALPLGLLGALLLRPRPFASIFVVAFGLLLGFAGGTVMAEAVSRATSGKRGTAVQLIAAAGVVAAGAARLLIAGELDLVARDLPGAVAVVVGAAVAWNRLR